MNIHKLISSRRSLGVLAVAAVLGSATYAAAASSNGPTLPAGKHSHQAVIAALRANLSADPAAKAAYLRDNPSPTLPNAGAASASQLEIGILNVTQAPFPRSLYAVQNHWQELRGATLLQVYAGAEGGDATQGVVVLKLIAWPADHDISTQVFSTPTPAGSLKVTAADGDDLTLASEGGPKFTFNIVSHTLTASS